MARTIIEIENEIIQAKESIPELDGLTSTSKVSIWRLWVFIVALAIRVHEQLWDVFKEEVDQLALQAIPGSLQYYYDQIIQYQHGHNVVFNPDTYRFYYLDTESDEAIAARILSRVSVREEFTSSFSGLRIKVAKNDPPEALTEEELTPLKFYINKIKFAGVATNVISLAPDEVKVNLKIYYDGTVVQSDIETRIKSALNTFLATIPFDSKLYRNKLIDALQATEGVIDVEVLDLLARKNGAPTWLSVPRMYLAESGYYTWKENDSNIVYNPE